MKKERDYFQKEGFEINSLGENSFWTRKSGRNHLFLKFVDFYFLKKVSNPSRQEINNFHRVSIKTANKEFKLPKALRLTVPNINSVLFMDEHPSKEIINLVLHRNKSVLGGQQETIFMIDRSKGTLYSPGVEITRIQGDAKLLWGNQKEFNKLNGHNRAYYFMKVMVQSLYRFE